MSTKNTLFLSNDFDEHVFEDCSEPLDEENDAITIEFFKENIRIDVNDADTLAITLINPKSEIYQHLKKALTKFKY